MPTSVNELEAQVLSLSAADRAHLLQLLIDSVDSNAKLGKGWVGEALRQETGARAGKRTLVSGAKALARLRASLP